MITENDLTGHLVGKPRWFVRWLLACQETTGNVLSVARLQAVDAGSGRLVGIRWNMIDRAWSDAGWDFRIVINAVVGAKYDGLREITSTDIAIFPE